MATVTEDADAAGGRVAATGVSVPRAADFFSVTAVDGPVCDVVAAGTGRGVDGAGAMALGGGLIGLGATTSGFGATGTSGVTAAQPAKRRNRKGISVRRIEVAAANAASLASFCYAAPASVPTEVRFNYRFPPNTRRPPPITIAPTPIQRGTLTVCFSFTESSIGPIFPVWVSFV